MLSLLNYTLNLSGLLNLETDTLTVQPCHKKFNVLFQLALLLLQFLNFLLESYLSLTSHLNHVLTTTVQIVQLLLLLLKQSSNMPDLFLFLLEQLLITLQFILQQSNLLSQFIQKQ